MNGLWVVTNSGLSLVDQQFVSRVAPAAILPSETCVAAVAFGLGWMG